jgi:hypothetical protein
MADIEKQATHTPGPWTLCEHSWSRIGIYSARCPIAALDIADDATEETQDEWERVMKANARLIAAAPELLALLQDWVESFADCIEGGEADPMVGATRAAIAKATRSAQ